jgi:hypothetical protein
MLALLILASQLALSFPQPSLALPQHPLLDTLRMRLAWEIAPGMNPASDSLGLVTGVTVDDAGNVYASDGLASTVWVFDRTGRLRGSVGRKGEGPGEFDAPTGPAVGPDGRLYVRDVYRVSRFGPDSTTGFLSRFEDSFTGPVYANWASQRATRFDSSGSLFYTGHRWLPDGTAREFFIRYDRSGGVRDTIFVPTYPNAPQLTAWVQTSAGGGRLLAGLNHVPFAPLPVWEITTAGTILSGDGRAYRLEETDAEGRVLRTFGRDLAPERMPRDERRDSLRALQGRLDSIPVGMDRVKGLPEAVRKLELPDVYPAYVAVYAPGDGTIWVRRWVPAGAERSAFDVFSREGEYRRTVEIPRYVETEPTPVLSTTEVVAVAIDRDTGVSVILCFRAPARRTPPGRSPCH